LEHNKSNQFFGPGTAIEFALALVEQLYSKEKMEEVAGPLESWNSNIFFLQC